MDRYLSTNSKITLKGIDGHYTVKDIIGRGSSCVVYFTEFENLNGEKSEHLLKEFNPRNIDLLRKENGVLQVANEEDAESFNELQERFIAGFKLQSELRAIEGLKNYTANIQNDYRDHGTVYIDMTVTAGESYSSYEEKSLYRLAKRIKTLATVIGNIHKNGYLHLDIKPSNIFVRPENEESDDVLLFDFDSLVPFSDENGLEKDAVISYTSEYAPLELVSSSRRNRIGRASDIYEIGELFFEKLMGRHSTAFEHNIMSRYEYDFSAPIFKNVNPKVKPLLDDLFRHTLCNTAFQRYQTTDELIVRLDEIVKIAEQKSFINDNFSYSHIGFVGRSSELKLIDGILSSDNDVLFVTGFGGIGKTELVKKYGNLHRSKYNRIIFLRYRNSILETISESLHVSNFNEKNMEKCYKRKIQIAIDDLSENDLLIIDNFNVDFKAFLTDNEEMERFRTLLEECKCKKIITTRIDSTILENFNYKVLNIGSIESDEEIYSIFKVYNNISYNPSDVKIIEKIIDYVNRHTLTVELLAKLLKASKKSPKTIMQKLITSEGITSINTTHVGNRKEGRKQYLTYETVNMHLLNLFDLSEISSDEKSLLGALSLFPDIRVDKCLFADWCKKPNLLESLNHLITLGWVEGYDNKVSLHQIILDLVYNNIKPNSSNYRDLVISMTEVIKNLNKISLSKSNNLKTVLHSFYTRIKGDDEIYVEFIFAYISYFINSKSFDPKIIKEIYKKTNNIDHKIHCDYYLAITLINCTDFWELNSDQLKQLALDVKSCFTDAEILCDNSITSLYNVSTMLLTCIEKIDLNTKCFPEEENNFALNTLYNYLIVLFDKLDNLILMNPDFSKEEAIKIYEFMASFFGMTDYTAFYSEKFKDFEKYKIYCKCIDKLKKPQTSDCNGCVESFDLTFFEMSIDREIEVNVDDKQYSKAIKIFEENSNNLQISEWTNYLIAQWYEKVKNYDKAIICYTASGDSDTVALDLARIYSLVGNNEAAIELCNKVISNNEFYVKNGNNLNCSFLENLLLALIQKSELVDDNEKKLVLKELENIYFSNKHLFESNNIPSFNVCRNFMIEYLQNTCRIDLAMMEQLEYVSSELWFEEKPIFDMLCAIINYDSDDYWINHCMIYASMLLFSVTWIDDDISNSIKAMEIGICQKMLEKIDQNELDSKFLSMYFYNQLAVHYEERGTKEAYYYFELCDYIYMLDYACEIFNLSPEVEFSKRNEIAYHYRLHNKNQLAEKCHKQNLNLAQNLDLITLIDNSWLKECVRNYLSMKQIDYANLFCKDYFIVLTNIYIKSSSDNSYEILSDVLKFTGECLLDMCLYESAMKYFMIYAIFLSLSNRSKFDQEKRLLSYIYDYTLLKKSFKEILNHFQSEEVLETYIEICKKILIMETQIDDIEIFEICKRFLLKYCYNDIDFKTVLEK